MLFVLFFTFIMSVGFAENGVDSKVVKSQVDKAYNLVQNKERAQAAEFLKALIKKEDRKSLSYIELNRALDSITHLFLLDKTQQLYELALSSLISDSRMAENKLNEAWKLEPENIKIAKALAVLKLSQGDCNQGLEWVLKAQNLYPQDLEAEVLLGRTYLCSSKTEKYLLLRAGLDPKIALQSPYWLMMDAQVQYQTDHIEKAKDLAETVLKLDPSYPTVYYWLWKINVVLKQKSESFAEKYLTLCEGQTQKLTRKFFVDPTICIGVKDIEDVRKGQAKPAE